MATGGLKKIRKAKKRTSTHKSSADSSQSPAPLLYRDCKGEIKKVEFVVGIPTTSPLPVVTVATHPNDDHVNISEMFLRTYKQLMQTNIINDDFYKSVTYDKDKESIILFNEDKGDYFEIYNGESKLSQKGNRDQNLMKPAEFKSLVKEYHLNNLYC